MVDGYLLGHIRDREIELTRLSNNLGAGSQLIGGHVYTITIRVADRAHNWMVPLNITFVTESIDFAAEEQAIRDLYAIYATAHGDQDEDLKVRSQKFGSQARAKTFSLLGHFGLAPLKKTKAQRQYRKHGREFSDCVVALHGRLTSPISLLTVEAKKLFAARII